MKNEKFDVKTLTISNHFSSKEELETGKNIELRSEEVQEVLGAVPPWILRQGIIVISLIVLVLLVGSWFFKYPDVVMATMTLTNITPPAPIVAKTNGKLTEFFIHDKQIVKEGTYLAIIENPASSEDMQLLKKQAEACILYPDSLILFPNKELKLGSVQGLYSSFIRSLNNYQQFIELAYYPKKITAIENRISLYKKYYSGMLRQQQLTNQQQEIAGLQFNRDSLLNKKEVLSDEEMNNAQNKYLQSLLAKENASSSLENLQIQLTQMQETLLDTEQQYMENKNTLESELNTLGVQLLNEINTWEQNYVLIAPIEGTVSFTNVWSKNQQVTAGENVFTVVPDNTSGWMGKALLPTARSGKVKVGQKVNIHFLNYPDEEFGMVRGEVSNIALIPDKDNYTVEIAFPNGLVTTYKKQLPFSQEMPARADIITEDLRLLERLVLPIKRIFKERIQS